MEIILYTTHCPLCKGLEKTWKLKNMKYTICSDVEQMRKLGIQRVPQLGIGGKLYSYKEALNWALSQE